MPVSSSTSNGPSSVEGRPRGSPGCCRSKPNCSSPSTAARSRPGKGRRSTGRRLHRPRYPFILSDNEIACFLSHRRAWKTILERELDGALIAEDDVEVDAERFASLWSEVAASATANDFVRFPRWERGESGDGVPGSPVAHLSEPFLPGLGMQMQYVAREAARKLLAATETFDRPVDSVVQMQWLHGARVLSARPIVIREIDFELGGTVLQRKKMPFAEKLIHELRRPFLRHAVRRMNRRWRQERRRGSERDAEH